MRKAAIDVGSNSILLTVAERAGGHWQSVEELSWVTALGEGARETGRLSDEAMERSLGALAIAYERARELESASVAAAGTMALRIAANASDFVERAARQGTPIEVLSAEQEARLGFHSVATDPEFAGHERLSTIDVGGHSTEITIGSMRDGEWVLEHCTSAAIGTLGLRSGPLREEAPSFGAILEASRLVDDALQPPLPDGGVGLTVALGAAGTNLVSVREGLEVWDPAKVHGAWLEYEEISRACGWLMRMTDEARSRLRGLEPGRERTIHIGALILERGLFALKSEGCSVSVRGWRYGLLDRGEGL